MLLSSLTSVNPFLVFLAIPLSLCFSYYVSQCVLCLSASVITLVKVSALFFISCYFSRAVATVIMLYFELLGLKSAMLLITGNELESTQYLSVICMLHEVQTMTEKV